MTIEPSDAWLLQASFHTESKGQGLKLIDLIAYVDYVNHAIMTFYEVEQGLKN